MKEPKYCPYCGKHKDSKLHPPVDKDFYYDLPRQQYVIRIKETVIIIPDKIILSNEIINLGEFSATP